MTPGILTKPFTPSIWSKILNWIQVTDEVSYTFYASLSFILHSSSLPPSYFSLFPISSLFHFSGLLGMQHHSCKKLFCLFYVQFLFIHIVGLVVSEAKFEVTLTGLLLREFTAAMKTSLGIFPSILNSWTVFFNCKSLKCSNYVIVMVWRKEIVQNSVKYCKYFPGYCPHFWKRVSSEVKCKFWCMGMNLFRFTTNLMHLR